MKTSFRLLVLLLIWLQLPPSFARAHHATATQFDTSKTVKIRGTIAKLDWANPHVHVSVDVKGKNWDVELGSPGAVIVAGLSKDVLKPGSSLTFDGYPGKANEFTLCAKQVTLPDGSTATFVVGI